MKYVSFEIKDEIHDVNSSRDKCEVLISEIEGEIQIVGNNRKVWETRTHWYCYSREQSRSAM